MNWLDRLSLRFLERQRIFEGGWGDVEALRPFAEQLKRRSDAPTLSIAWAAPRRDTGLTVQDGVAASPAEVLPPALRTLHVRRLVPPRPIGRRLIIPPSWGDAGYGARMFVYGALVSKGLEVWLLEGAWFGLRQAPFTTVEAFFRMGLGHIEEVRALLQTCRHEGATPTLAGYSMAGQLGGMAVQSLPFEVPVVVLSCAPSPDAVFVDGPLSRQIDWAALGPDARARLAEAMREVSVLSLPPPLSSRRAVGLNTGDGIVPPDATERLAAHWGVTPTTLATGHLGAYAFHRRALQARIAQTVLD